jgi:DNA (cytosine-5)-methyltransferase 1
VVSRAEKEEVNNIKSLGKESIIRFIDLFAGIGGFRYGLEKASQHFKCVYSNEWDKYASSIYKQHYGEIDTRDIRTVKANEIPDHDLLCGGFPCQAFSVAGKRKGFDDTRGTLFFEIARIVSAKRPRYLLLENVKGLLSHDEGKTFQTILGVLSDLGYRVEWQVLNSKHFGVPQNRERVFIVGYLGGFGGRKVFPLGGGSKEVNKTKKLPEQISNTLRTNYSNAHSNETYIGELQEITKGKSQGARVYKTEGIAQTMSSVGGGQGAKTGLYAIRRGRSDDPWVKARVSPTIRTEAKADVRAVLTPDREQKRQNGRRFKEIGDPSFTLTGQDKHGIYDGVRIRRFTPTECARLQGFPDSWHEGLSDTQAYKCYGNAVTTNVIEAIGRRIAEIWITKNPPLEYEQTNV